MTVTKPDSEISAGLIDAIFDAWLERFDAALEAGDAAGCADCVLEDGYWRDILGLGWTFTTSAGRREIET